MGRLARSWSSRGVQIAETGIGVSVGVGISVGVALGAGVLEAVWVGANVGLGVAAGAQALSKIKPIRAKIGTFTPLF